MSARAPLTPAPKWFFTLIFGAFTVWFLILAVTFGLLIGSGILCGIAALFFGFLTFRSLVTPRRRYDIVFRRWILFAIAGAAILAVLYYTAFIV